MAEDLETLLATLGEEAVVEIDYDAPEAGSFQPRVLPGTYDFIFHMPEDQSTAFDKVSIQGKDYLSVTHEMDVIVPGEEEPVRIKFCRVNDYKHEKMANSSLGELVRSLGIKPETNDRRGLVNALKSADGRARGRAQIAWSRYCKSCQHIVSTAPRKRKPPKKNDSPWPRNPDKTPQLVVECPFCADKGYGREEVQNYKLPEKAA